MRMMPCADSGLLIEVESLEAVIALYDCLTAMPPEGVVDMVPAGRTLLLKLDPQTAIRVDIERAIRSAVPTLTHRSHGETICIPVVYDGADLAFVADLTGMSQEAVITAHTTSLWSVAFCGFSPGFAYLVGGDERLEVPRNRESRTRVPAGSVGLAGVFSGIYPRESPGGWQLIGRTMTEVWATEKNPPALLRPGVQVRFEVAG